VTVAFGERVRAMQNRVARHVASTEMTVVRTNATSFGDDLSVTISSEPQAPPCSAPRPFTAEDAAGRRVLTGESYVLVDRSAAELDFDLQPDQIVELGGEQHRVAGVDYLPGALRVRLHGGAAGGAEGS